MSAWSYNPVDRWRDFKRHLQVLKHLTPTRAFNLAVNLLCARFKTRRVPGYPYVLRLDPTNLCNFKCVLCPTGMRNYGRKPAMMKRETYKKAIDELSPWIIRVWYYIWGEPLLHPELPEWINYAVKRGLSTNLSTNLSLLTPDLAKNLVASGIEYLIASVDGANSETYSKYRIGGNFQEVVGNIRLLLDERRKARSKNPFVELQCLVTSDTENQLDEVEKLGMEIGVDRVRFMPLALPYFPYRGEDSSGFEGWFPKKQRNYRYIYEPGKPANNSSCFWLYEGLTLNPDGGISPCCRSYFKNEDFGNIHNDSVRKIFNNEKFQKARSLFSQNPIWNGIPIVCDGCRDFQQSPHL